MAKTKTITPESVYKVKRGTRRDKMLQTWLYSKLVRAAQDEYGDFKQENWHEAPPEFAAMMQSPDTVEAFCRIVLYTDRNGDLNRLTTEDGHEFAIPDYKAHGDTLLAAYWDWLCTDETVTGIIDDRILAANERLVEPGLLPKAELTADERADPN